MRITAYVATVTFATVLASVSPLPHNRNCVSGRLVAKFEMSYDNAFDGSSIVRLIARVFAWRYDQQLLDGVTVEPGSPLAIHIARVTSHHERRVLPRTLNHVLREAAVVQAYHSQGLRPN